MYGAQLADMSKTNNNNTNISGVTGTPPTNAPNKYKRRDWDTTDNTHAAVDAVIGTDQYIAPEAYLGTYTPFSDMFAVGVMLYKVVDTNFPFKDSIFDDD
jgi:serine/threonine protein kinase